MNFFLFDPLDLINQAAIHPDKLVVKMQLEAAQLLNNHLPKEKRFWKITHIKHPCSLWLGESKENLSYGLKYLESLALEYESRYKKESSYWEKIYFLRNTINPDLDFPVEYPVAINHYWLDEFLQDKIINEFEHQLILSTKRCPPYLVKILYRNYLLRAKTHYAEWRYSCPPKFWGHENLSKYNGRFCKI